VLFRKLHSDSSLLLPRQPCREAAAVAPWHGLSIARSLV